MFFTHRAYLNAKGGGSILVLTHDVKRALTDSTIKKGLISIVSMGATTGVALMENDAAVWQERLKLLQKQFADVPNDKVARRSGLGGAQSQLMAAAVGLNVTLSFNDVRLIVSPFHEIVALDFEPKPGRREFVISIQGDGDAK